LDKTVFITGTSRGLGLELARHMAGQDFTVFAGWHGQCSQELEDLQREFAGKIHTLEIDIADDGSVQKAAGYISGHAHTLDIIINNGAILGDMEATPGDKLDFAKIQQVFNVNTLGALRVTNALLTLLLNGPTKLIVNISSEAGSIGDCAREGWFAYCGSKAALNMQSALVHNYLKNLGGQVLLIHPGWMKTNMRGHIDEEAPYTAAESAVKIAGLIANAKQYRAERPAFIDFEGKKLPW
jgi:NAD(P)-dependent dehydrogenase (short-subunit alcohol dehydrogenase family)